MRKLMDRLALWLAERDAALQRRLEIEYVFGPEDAADRAHTLALEAGKLGLRPEDLAEMARSHNVLQAFGMELEPGDSFLTWGLRHGGVRPDDIVEARKLDLLGMRDDT
jgi:hypothetical protein